MLSFRGLAAAGSLTDPMSWPPLLLLGVFLLFVVATRSVLRRGILSVCPYVCRLVEWQSRQSRGVGPPDSE